MIAAPQRLKAGNERSAAGTALLLMTKASCAASLSARCCALSGVRCRQHREYPQTFRVLHSPPPVIWTVRLLKWCCLALAARDIPNPDKRYLATNATPEPLIGNRFWPCRGVGPECKAERVRSIVQSDKSAPGSQTAAVGELGAAEQGMREAHSGAAGRFSWRRTPRPVRCP